MRDPRVMALYYSIGAAGDNSFGNPKPIAFTNDLGTFSLQGSRLRVEPLADFAKPRSALSAMEPFLKSWELQADLLTSVGAIRFTYDRADVIDRNPPGPGEPKVLQVEAADGAVLSEEVRIRVTRNTYPSPPQLFVVTTDVEILSARYLGYVDGREPLQSMAYFVLTYLEVPAGGRKPAAATLQVDFDILDTIGQLSAVGDAASARKVQRTVSLRPLTGSEKQWLEAAVKRLIIRVGELAASTSLPMLSMSDLPAI